MAIIGNIEPKPETEVTEALQLASDDYRQFITNILEPAKDDLEAKVRKNAVALHQAFGVNLLLAHSVDYLQAVRFADGIKESRKDLVKTFDERFSVAGAYLGNRKMELIDAINNALKHIRLDAKRYQSVEERYGEISYQSLMEEEGRVMCHLESYRFDYCRVVLLPALRALSDWQFECIEDVLKFARGDFLTMESSYYPDSYDSDDPSTAIDQMIELCNPPCKNCEQSADECFCEKYVFAGASGQFEPAFSPTSGELDELLSEISPSYRRS
ncbi:hypothetical protein G7021_07540 [Pseudomonas carnis]|uniref:hypothetical protein n=1 Tax=Pseudomonas TaxID=286 RepID=UPI000CD10B81|nr:MULTISPECIES: hypothetical protein [Pseudomonas]MBA1252509.1 hypothetical protein [Pseudomonas carnis]MBA1268409.1 hypothetical protein [Pseudomonas carnis]PNY77089.1 hypothetical protein C1751_10725 [Pseudomonas fluorescens]